MNKYILYYTGCKRSMVLFFAFKEGLSFLLRGPARSWKGMKRIAKWLSGKSSNEESEYHFMYLFNQICLYSQSLSTVICFLPLPFYLLQSIFYIKSCKILYKSSSICSRYYVHHNIITFLYLSCYVGFWAWLLSPGIFEILCCMCYFSSPSSVVHCMDGVTVCLPI